MPTLARFHVEPSGLREMNPESEPEQPAPRESRRDSLRRHGRRAWLYTWAGALVALLAILIALIVANTGRVKVSWVLGSTHQSLVWIILATAILGWLLGIVTSMIFRFRTRRRNSAR
jgi:uncharacterized integral membrane protein